MTKVNDEQREISCIALGGLDGAKFAGGLKSFRGEMQDLEQFVAKSCEATKVAHGPMVSLGHEVQHDALFLKHIETKLLDGVSQLITLLALTRVASEAVASADTK